MSGHVGDIQPNGTRAEAALVCTRGASGGGRLQAPVALSSQARVLVILVVHPGSQHVRDRHTVGTAIRTQLAAIAAILVGVERDVRLQQSLVVAAQLPRRSCAEILVHRGATGVIMRDIDMGLMFKAIEQEKITTTMSVPALLQFMLDAPQREQTDMSSIRWIAIGTWFGPSTY